MAETERGVRFTLRTATAEDYRTPFGKIGEEIDRLEARFKGLTLPTGMFDALTAVSTRSVTVVRDNLKAMQAWEDKQTQFEERAAERRAKLGTKFDQDRTKAREKMLRDLDRETAKAEKEKAREDRALAKALEIDDKEALRRKAEAARGARANADRIRAAQQAANDATRQGIDGAMQLGRAFALAGLIGQEDFGKVRDTILGVQSAIDAVRGGIDVYRAARGVGGAAVGATGVVGGAATGAAAAGAVAPAIASLGPFALAVGRATVAVLALKKGLDLHERTFRAQARNAAIDRLPGGLSQTQYNVGSFLGMDIGLGGPDSMLFGPGVVGGEDPAKASGKAPGLFKSLFANLWGQGTSIAEAKEHIGKQADTEAKTEAQRSAEIFAAKRNQEFQERQTREEQAEAGRRLQQEQAVHISQQANEAALRVFGVDPDLAARAAGIRGRRELQEGQLESRSGTLGRVRQGIEQQKEVARNATGADALSAQRQAEAMTVRARQLEKEIVDLKREGYELDRQGKEATLEGLRQRASLEKAAYTGRRSDQAKFGDLDPFQQQMVAGLIRKAKAGTLEKYERRLLSSYNLKETEAILERQSIAETERMFPGLFVRGAEQERSEKLYHEERAITQETKDAVTQAGGAFAVTATGDLRIVLDFDKDLAKQFQESIAPDLENLSLSIKDEVAAVFTAARDMVENGIERSKENTRKMIEANDAKKNATNRQPAVP